MAAVSIQDVAVYAGADSLPLGVLLRSYEGFYVEPPEEEPGDVTAPVVSIVSPTEGSAIMENTPLVLDVTDTGLKRALLWVTFPTLGTDELVFNGSAFTSQYSASSRVAITNGFRFTVVRRGGWPASPQLSAAAYDASGNES